MTLSLTFPWELVFRHARVVLFTSILDTEKELFRSSPGGNIECDIGTLNGEESIVSIDGVAHGPFGKAPTISASQQRLSYRPFIFHLWNQVKIILVWRLSRQLLPCCWCGNFDQSVFMDHYSVHLRIVDSAVFPPGANLFHSSINRTPQAPISISSEEILP
jgi:hypothetical protein